MRSPYLTVPAACVAGPNADALARARNEITAALREVEALPPNMEPSERMLRAQSDSIARAMAALLPLATGLADHLGGDPVEPPGAAALTVAADAARRVH